MVALVVAITNSRRIYLVVIIILALVIGSVFLLTQYKSYQLIKEQSLATTSSQSVDIPFMIENADKPWKIEITIQSEYGEVQVWLLTAQEVNLWFNSLYEGTYEYSFSNTGDLKFRFRVPSYSNIQVLEFRILAWKSLLGW